MSTPPQRPDHNAAIPAEDLAALEAEKQRLLAVVKLVAEGTPCRRKAPRQMGRISGAANMLLKALRDGLAVLRAPPADGQPWPEPGNGP